METATGQSAYLQNTHKSGVHSSTVFMPPKGMKKASGEETLTEFSYEAIMERLSSGCQLWAVRLPQSVSAVMH